MKMYCMCREKNEKLDGQKFLAPNRFAPYDTETDFRGIALNRPMELIKTGAKQVILLNGVKLNDWKTPITEKEIISEHHPTVDVFQCKHCGAIIIRE